MIKFCHPRLWSIDFHVHTSFSYDCATAPRDAIEVARKKGLDGIAVTDHETEEGGLATAEANCHPDFLVIPGAELKTDRGDLIGLYLTHPIRSRKFESVLEEIVAQGGISVVPHPLRSFRTIEEFISIRQQFPMVDAWEIMNGRYHQKLLSESVEFFERLAILNASAGSDAHFVWEIGSCRSVLYGLPATALDFRRLIAEGFNSAVSRADLAVSFGIQLAGLVRDAKARRYASAAQRLCSLPHRAARKAFRNLINPQPTKENCHAEAER